MKLNVVARCRSWALLSSGLLAVSALALADNAEPNRIYDTNCALCHQKAGIGMKGQFPRLAGRAGEIAATTYVCSARSVCSLCSGRV